MKFSFIIPFKNTFAYLDTRIESIIQQNIQSVEYEILLINDHSQNIDKYINLLGKYENI